MLRPVPTPRRPSPLALAVLGLLEVGPLHPYAIGRLLKLWGKDQVVNVGQRSNLYRAINRLNESGLIAILQTERDQQFPERTVYEITEEGRLASREWLAEILSTPRNEFPEFPAALSFAMLLEPGEARAVLAQRAATLRDERTRLKADLSRYSADLPRVTLLETEYQRAVIAAELAWVERIVNDLDTGTLTWSAQDFESAAGAAGEAGMTTDQDTETKR
jgi:DNA-binding PadR family transcriptional regulator